MNILMIEDNESVAEMMSMFFEQQKDWEATFIQDGEEGWQHYLANEETIEMVILDLNLPSKDGIQICRDIRQQNKQVPIIMLTARDAESEQVLGLGLGADDYVTKPFDPITFMARMRALYRRSQLSESPVEATEEKGNADQFDIQTEFIRINSQNREAFYKDQLIQHLTPKEFEILQLLARRPKQVFTREHLLTTLWEDPFYGDERTVDAHIKKLRQKMEEYGPQLIQTVWGVGYKFDETGV
ncbi:response regulator [Carnobacterium sp. PL24RED07]|uniref:response regulator transcription factor n=1 Tax=unclassified Carnobacterium TaxID=257487 RepID=UPI000EC92592|nr:MULTISPECIES: response regulator transcription factor [unclassified Carnobacterium]KAF3303247.1 response regulator [Carnobacterium sp. PL26RED25]KAF3306531.1 response regulator [Carnobacterium sp. PL24RED07]HCT98148.1 DNA-binding response regulator [Aerococcus urinaeequi]